MRNGNKAASQRLGYLIETLASRLIKQLKSFFKV